ncbi:Tm-1-like ATP-binding domain-containing protein [Parapedobacter sp. 2B3]|uniref:Tm-1-like ATP-binding domain-containing protein n=1 Tax=Parapedobacter sp. 2B3 TaxID=3342381 RepID=UPI0035B59A8A
MGVDSGTIVMLGCFDTKGEDFSLLRERIITQGQPVFSINVGVKGTTSLFPVDIEAADVAAAAGRTLDELRSLGDRGVAVEEMGRGAAMVMKRLFGGDHVAGVIGMGGGGGTHIALTAMQAVPFGIPKVCLSTVATRDLSMQVGSADIALFPSVVDIGGINSISRITIGHAASAICGMVRGRQTAEADHAETKGRIAISMFGNTTACVNACTTLLRGLGYEVFSFHANGAGGRTMESLIAGRYFDGVLDITTTELADELCGGVCSAGPHRMTAAAKQGIPQVIVPGCMDMVNFGTMESVPAQYRDRFLYSWAPDVTLMRTDEAENIQLGEQFALKANALPKGTVVLLPLHGLSQLDAEGGLFHAPPVNRVLFKSIREHVDPSVKVAEVPHHINDREFAAVAVDTLLGLIRGSGAADNHLTG